MRRIAGIVLALFGLVIGLVPGAFVLWAHQQFTTGLSDESWARLVIFALLGMISLAIGCWLARRRPLL